MKRAIIPNSKCSKWPGLDILLLVLVAGHLSFCLDYWNPGSEVLKRGRNCWGEKFERSDRESKRVKGLAAGGDPRKQV